jgi:DNA-binding beta-propeller fold protein YncE
MRLTIKIIYAAFAVVILAIGTVTANGASGDLFASVNGTGGNGGGFIYKYTPNGVQSTFASGLSRPRGLAFDSHGNLFVATNFCDNAGCHPTILKITPDGAQTVFGIIPVSFFAEGVAIDGSDNVFVMANDVGNLTLSIIYKFTPSGKRMPFGFLPDPGGQGFDLAFDSAGNLFAVDAAFQTVYEFAPDGTRSVFVGPSAFPPIPGNAPIGLAFNHVGHLFVSTEMFPFTNDTILKFTPSGVESTFAMGLDSPLGLVFDSAGNLFVAEWPEFATGDILKFMPDGTSTIFASGIGIPQGNGGPVFLAIQP